MAVKRVTITRKEINITNEEAKQFILEKVFIEKGTTYRVKDFASLVQTCGLEMSESDSLERLLNELIKEGKLRIQYQSFHAACISGYELVIKRIS